MSGRRGGVPTALLAGLLLLLLVLALCAGCAWTLTGDRQQRISDCLRRCEAQQGGEPMAPPNTHDYYRDTRSPCERECHAIK